MTLSNFFGIKDEIIHRITDGQTDVQFEIVFQPEARVFEKNNTNIQKI